ncbi:MAG: phosphoribosylaminoimidazole carboxylase [Verrucomicrobiota bacterium]
MMMNIFENLPEAHAGEVIEKIAQFSQGAVRIERILSAGHASAADYWYEQNEDEWVLLLRGQASLLIAGRGDGLEMKAGDCLELPAKLRHRVDKVSQDALWLAIHVRAGGRS